MGKQVLLTSETYVKSVMSISDNLAGKYLRPSILEAQDIALREVIGSALLNKLKTLVGTGDIEQSGNAAYKDLVDEAQYFLAYNAAVEVATKVAYKVVNFGVAKTRDENLEGASQDEVEKLKYYYQSKADHACLELQSFVLTHRADYPELDENTCERLSSSLRSAASCGIWLGGPRGRRLPGMPVGRKTRY